MSSTRLVLGDALSVSITTKRGSKQGDPMSVYLFNAVIDFCKQKNFNTNIGYKIGDELVTYTAFADNIAKITSAGCFSLSCFLGTF